MADPRFFVSAGPMTLAAVAGIARGQLGDGADPMLMIGGVGALDAAGPGEIAFLEGRRHLEAFRRARAGACIVDPRLAAEAPSGMALILSAEPQRAFARVAGAFHPEPVAEGQVHPAATVDPAARLGMRVDVGPGAVIGPGATIGEGSSVGANTILGAGVAIGRDCRIGANVTISHAQLGDRVRVFPGVRIGQDGFGYALGPQGHLKIPQLGRVLIGEDVEIGANTTIDRGALGDTVIGPGCVIDNLVQIAHNVRLGRGCVVVSQVGISGSTHVGDGVVIGGQAGLAGHLLIGSGVRIAAQSGVHRDVLAGETVGGSPAIPMREFRRLAGAWRRLARARPGRATDVEE